MSNIRTYDKLIIELSSKIERLPENKGTLKFLFTNDKNKYESDSIEFMDNLDEIQSYWASNKSELKKVLNDGDDAIILFYLDFPQKSYIALYKAYSIEDISMLNELKIFITRHYDKL